jgi:hypothetical protein
MKHQFRALNVAEGWLKIVNISRVRSLNQKFWDFRQGSDEDPTFVMYNDNDIVYALITCILSASAACIKRYSQ